MLLRRWGRDLQAGGTAGVASDAKREPGPPHAVLSGGHMGCLLRCARGEVTVRSDLGFWKIAQAAWQGEKRGRGVICTVTAVI